MHKSSNLGRIGLFILEFFALGRGSFSPYTYNGENHVSTFYQLITMDSIFIKLTGNKDRHQISKGSNSGQI